MKNTWKWIKQLNSIKSRKTQCPNNIVVNNRNITDSREIADVFNEYFASIGPKLAQSISRVNKSYTEYLTYPQCASFFIDPTTTKEIEEEITGLNINIACRPYSVPFQLLKIIKALVSYPLSHLFNLSFLFGVVPDKLKVARVIPVYKVGNCTIMSNY